LAGRNTNPARPRWWRNTRGEWYLVVQALLMLLVLLGPRFDRAVWGDPWSLVTMLAGALLVVGGVVLGVAGMRALGANFTPLPRPREGAALVDRGVYSLVRHPIYAGLVLAAFGWGLWWRSPVTLVLAGVLLAFFDIKSRREEIWLAEAFPRYGEYRRRVKKLIPWIY
jgi:protein-S-isoprenylcysteine O-methyltransferase Ste14